MWELEHREDWVPKNWCFQTVVLDKMLESPLDIKEIKPVNPKGNQPWIFIGRTNAEASILWPPCAELTHLKRPWCWERLMAWGEGGDREWDGWMASLTQWTWFEQTPGDSGQEAWHAALHGVAKSQTGLSHWTSTAIQLIYSWQLL